MNRMGGAEIMMGLKICNSDGMDLLSNAFDFNNRRPPFSLLNFFSLVAKLASTSNRDIGIGVAII